MNQAADAMLEDLELSPLTRQTYFYGVKAFIRFLHLSEGDDEAAEALDPYPLERINEETLSAFNRWLHEAYPDPRAEAKGKQSVRGSRTGRTYLVATKHLINWLDLHELLPEGVSYDRMLRRIKGTRGRKRQGYKQRKVDPDVMKILTHYMNKPLPKRRGMPRLVLLRNRAFVAFLYDTGARVSEALALTREDVLDGRADKVRLTETKNGKPRTVFLSEETRQLLQEYVRERKDSVYAPLFVSHGRDKGTAITPSHAWLLIKKAARAEGLYENTSPHSLRHRRAQDLLDQGMPLEWVAALLGHEHPDTTRTVYAWETDEERLADMVETYGLDPSEASNG
ncbi:MAG: site-specific integrase [Anaerolineae bacterium]